MRNILKATTLESKLPLLAVEHGCIISKDADITVCYEVTLPELFTVTSQEYEAMHAAWCKAIKVLPRFTVAHKQDWFVSENYQPELQKDNLSFLDRSFERHFNERPYLAHKCYLYLTKTTKERMRQQSNFSTLCRGRITPKELNHEMIVGFMEAVGQFERIINDTGYISLRRMGDDEIVGTDSTSGIIERYLSLSTGDVTCLEDIDLSPKEMRVGDKMLCRMLLVDRHILSRAINFACGSYNDSFHAAVARSLHHVQSAAYVGIHITVRSHIAVRNGYESGQMEHYAASFGYMAAEVRITHITAHHLQIGMLYAFEPTPVIERIIIAECSDAVTLGKQQLGEMRPYEAVGTRHQYFLFAHFTFGYWIQTANLRIF